MSSWSRALDTLVRERGAALFGYAYVLTGNRAEAEDLVHDALVRTFRRGRANGSIDSAHAYVKHAITTAFIDGGRRASIRPQRAPGDVGDVSTPASAAHAPATPDHSPDVAQALDLHAAILTLPPRERACIVLRYLDDRPIAGVAAELGLATGTVKRYLADAVAKLRTIVADVDFDDPTHPPTDVRVTVAHHSTRSKS